MLGIDGRSQHRGLEKWSAGPVKSGGQCQDSREWRSGVLGLLREPLHKHRLGPLGPKLARHCSAASQLASSLSDFPELVLNNKNQSGSWIGCYSFIIPPTCPSALSSTSGMESLLGPTVTGRNTATGQQGGLRSVQPFTHLLQWVPQSGNLSPSISTWYTGARI